MAAVRAARSAGIFIIFMVLDNPNSRVREQNVIVGYFPKFKSQFVTKPRCCAAGFHSRHQGAHLQRARGAARDPLLHGWVSLSLLRDPARHQRLAGNAQRRTQAVVWTCHCGWAVGRWGAIFLQERGKWAAATAKCQSAACLSEIRDWAVNVPLFSYYYCRSWIASVAVLSASGEFGVFCNVTKDCFNLHVWN